MKCLDSPRFVDTSSTWILELSGIIITPNSYNFPFFDVILVFSLMHFEFRAHIWTCSNESNSLGQTSRFIRIVYQAFCDSYFSFSFALDLELLNGKLFLDFEEGDALVHIGFQ